MAGVSLRDYIPSAVLEKSRQRSAPVPPDCRHFTDAIQSLAPALSVFYGSTVVIQLSIRYEKLRMVERCAAVTDAIVGEGFEKLDQPPALLRCQP